MQLAVSLTYFGHSAFLWTSPQGFRVLIDPYGNRLGRDWFLRLFPTVAYDLLLITHDHFDHTGIDLSSARAPVIREEGRVVHRDVAVTGIRDLHVREGPIEMANVLFRLDIAGLRFLHFGDNRADVPGDLAQMIDDVDVLMIPVDDSCHLLSFDQVDRLIDLIAPKVVIPMHYLIPGLTSESSALKLADLWLATQRTVRRLQTHELRITIRSLPPSREVWVLNAAP